MWQDETPEEGGTVTVQSQDMLQVYTREQALLLLREVLKQARLDTTGATTFTLVGAVTHTFVVPKGETL